MKIEIERRPDFPIPPEVLEETRRWLDRAFREAVAAGDVEEIERLGHGNVEDFARAGMLSDAR